jgi:hypothetical protein
VIERNLGCEASPDEAVGDADVSRPHGSQEPEGGVNEAGGSGHGSEVDAGVEQYLDRRRKERDQAIDRLQAEGAQRGSTVDRSFWAMVYDFEHAPSTSNRKQLKAIGVEVPPDSELADDELGAKLQEIFEGLARLHVYLLNTNHLSDRDLYERLDTQILDEGVRDVVATEGVQEWVDLGMMEDQEVFDAYYNDFGPNRAKPPSDRDSRLPRPPGYPDGAA